MKKTCTTEQALLNNHKTEQHFRNRPSESTTLATPLIIYCTSFVSFSGLLLIFLACYWYAGTQDWLRPVWSKMSAHLYVATQFW
uniref:Transmembrane protein n=1 Tax=Mesocestoides corti TaxID=53468 RepID=A0A5K3G039_MESCO